MFLFFKLPSAFFSGVRVQSLDPSTAIVRVPYKWFTRNPFRSTYFASLSMAAEMSTGLLGLAHVYKSRPPVSILVVRIEGEFSKKAVGITYFTCSDGLRFREVVREAIESGESRLLQALSVGKNEEGVEIARFTVTWSVKARMPKNGAGGQ